MADEPMSTGSGQSRELQIVVCELADEHYGLDIAKVFEIIRHQQITAVPRAPSFVKGVINLRGRIIPVVDLRARFGMPEVEPTKETRIVVAESSFHQSRAHRRQRFGSPARSGGRGGTDAGSRGRSGRGVLAGHRQARRQARPAPRTRRSLRRRRADRTRGSRLGHAPDPRPATGRRPSIHGRVAGADRPDRGGFARVGAGVWTRP